MSSVHLKPQPAFTDLIVVCVSLAFSGAVPRETATMQCSSFGSLQLKKASKEKSVTAKCSSFTFLFVVFVGVHVNSGNIWKFAAHFQLMIPILLFLLFLFHSSEKWKRLFGLERVGHVPIPGQEV